jgi:FixJ family two-component response regulator
MLNSATVAVVDDDESIRESLPDLVRELGFQSSAFSSAEEFLSSKPEEFQCLILDIAMPGMSGPELQKQLKARGYHIPIIFITARRDEEIKRRVLEEGAVDFLHKPYSETALERALGLAFNKPL